MRIELLVAAAVAVVAASGAPAATPGIPAIYIDYSADCTFAMTVDGIGPITSAATTLPPGTYQLLISMQNPNQGYTCGRPVFTFTGPGVNSVAEFRGEELYTERVAVLQASSTYVAVDTTAPGGTRKVVTTAASGSSSALIAPGAQAGFSKGSAQAGLVGSGLLRYQGTLVAAVSATGKLTLKRPDGRSVGSLIAGKYDIKVDDADPRAGFFIQHRNRKAVTVTSLAFVGKRTQRVTLTAGKWTFFSKVGKPTLFTATAGT
jgi:hypothetical protein